MGIIKKWKEKLKRRSLKVTLAMYIMGGIVGTIIVCILIINYFDSWEEIIRNSNGITERQMVMAFHTVYTLESTSIPGEVLKQIAILETIRMLVVFFCIVSGIVFVSWIYYKKKLETPLEILELEIKRIADDDLSFDCSYLSGDEMEEICKAFNRMRLQLIKSRKEMWGLLEKQRELNAAFAHDVRTPVTVMKGYSQMLLKFYPEGRVSSEKLLETLKMIDRQADRLERFSGTMKEIHSIDEYRVEKKKAAMGEVMDRLFANLKGMAGEGMEIFCSYDGERDRLLHCDLHLIEEVADNLFANGLRHAKKRLELYGNICEGKLEIYVKDDGPGFSKEVQERAMRPYFSTDEEHFGMGLTICKTLCAKHGGGLEITNSIHGGAIVCAMFEAGC